MIKRKFTKFWQKIFRLIFFINLHFSCFIWKCGFFFGEIWIFSVNFHFLILKKNQLKEFKNGSGENCFNFENLFLLNLKYICVFRNFTIWWKFSFIIKLETCFSFLIHCWPIRACECDTFIITKQYKKCNFSVFSRNFLIIFVYRIDFTRM